MAVLAEKLADAVEGGYEPASLRLAGSDERLWLLTIESASEERPTLAFVGSHANPRAVTVLVDDYTIDAVSIDDAAGVGGAVLRGDYRVELRKLGRFGRPRPWLVVAGAFGAYEASSGLGGELSVWEREALA
jgi:hypothetical protein